MAMKAFPCKFDKDALWKKVQGRKAISLDTNAWINMADDKSAVATRVKGTLRKLVSDGLVFCPLSMGVVLELYKQAQDSRLKTGTLMEELSLNVSYANKCEIFSWEIDRFVSRELGIGPIDLSLAGLYVPIVGYLSSQLNIGFPEESASEQMNEKVRGLSQKIEALTLTDILKLDDDDDWSGNYVKQLPDPPMSAVVKRIRERTKGNKGTMFLLESQAVLELEVLPGLRRLSPQVKERFMAYVHAAKDKAPTDKSPKEQYAAFLAELFTHLPALYNHVDLLTTISQNPTQAFEINDWFDHEIMPVPLAYASAFVAQDKGIRDVVRNRTQILKRNACCYCFDLGELEEWLKKEGVC